jgi:hypothetical protein
MGLVMVLMAALLQDCKTAGSVAQFSDKLHVLGEALHSQCS